MEKKINTYVTFILDRSGSMQSCVKETINGFNENVQVIRRTAKENDMEDATFVSLVQFNDQIEFSQFAASLEKLQEIDDRNYQPNGSTAMLDAIGEALSRMDREIADDDNNRYLVTVFTDGEENASKEYTYETIGKMIRSRTNTNRWTFSYIGANQDLSKVADRTHIPRQNMMAYTSDREGTEATMFKVSESIGSFMTHSRRGGGTMFGMPGLTDGDDKSVNSDPSAKSPKKAGKKKLH